MKSVYTGDEKVAEFESYDELRVGENKPAFIYEGSELVYPNPVKDGLVLWYDFSGRTNTDGQRGIAEDLSGNGNHGTLQNFNFTPESGYDKNKLLFDGVDDHINIPKNESHEIIGGITIEQTIRKLDDHDVSDGYGWDWLFNNGNNTFAEKGYNLYISSSGFLSFAYGGLSFNTDYKPEKGNFFHVHASWNSQKHIVIIVNGITLYDKLHTILTPQVSKFPIRIGKASYYGASPNLMASVYSAKLYNRPLTPEEIAHNYAIEKERFGIE